MRVSDLSPSHGVKGHSPIIGRDGNDGVAFRVSPFIDKFVRFNVPHFDHPIVVTADDLGAPPGYHKTSYVVLVLHRCLFLLSVLQIPDLHSSIIGTGDDSSSAREIREREDADIVRRDYQVWLRSIIVRLLWCDA